MRRRQCILLLAAVTLLAIPARFVSAQSNSTMTVPQVMAAVKPGQWILLEGTPQANGTVLCSKIKVLTGAIDDSAWSIRTTLRGVDPAKQALTVGQYHVALMQHPKFNSPTGSLKGLSGLKTGMLVKVEGVYHSDGSFVAKKVNDESDQVPRKAGIEKKLRLQGRIQRLDPAQKTITVMGTTFMMSAATRVESAQKS